MKKYLIVFLLIFGFFQNSAQAEDLYNEYYNKYMEELKYIEADREDIHLLVDFEKNIITLNRLIINRPMPIGVLELTYRAEYVVPIKQKTFNRYREITISGTDYFDGIGTHIKISYFRDSKTATISIESQFENLNISYVPQLIPIKITKNKICIQTSIALCYCSSNIVKPLSFRPRLNPYRLTE